MPTDPTPWQLSQAYIENIRLIHRRAEADSLLFAALFVGFLILRQSAASSVSVLGFQIEDLRVVQFSLTPLAAFLTLRYAKAQTLCAAIGAELKEVLESQLPSVSRLATPPDWDLLHDLSFRFRLPYSISISGGQIVMAVLVGAGAIVNMLDATVQDAAWASATGVCATLLLGLGVVTRPSWSTAVIAR